MEQAAQEVQVGLRGTEAPQAMLRQTTEAVENLYDQTTITTRTKWDPI